VLSTVLLGAVTVVDALAPAPAGLAPFAPVALLTVVVLDPPVVVVASALAGLAPTAVTPLGDVVDVDVLEHVVDAVLDVASPPPQPAVATSRPSATKPVASRVLIAISFPARGRRTPCRSLTVPVARYRFRPCPAG
jgi:hypothetical protein